VKNTQQVKRAAGIFVVILITAKHFVSPITLDFDQYIPSDLDQILFVHSNAHPTSIHISIIEYRKPVIKQTHLQSNAFTYADAAITMSLRIHEYEHVYISATT